MWLKGLDALMSWFFHTHPYVEQKCHGNSILHFYTSGWDVWGPVTRRTFRVKMEELKCYLRQQFNNHS